MSKFKISRLPRPLISAAMIAALVTTSAQAAVLSNLDGVVSVNHGNGFQPASIGSSLAPGDRVRTGEGSASILYDNGCATTVGPKQVAMVYSEAPVCNVGGYKDGPSVVAAPEPGVSPLLIGGVLAGTAVGIAIAISNNNKTPSPVSP